MEFAKFLEEYEQLDIENLEREQLESFRSIFFEHGMLEKSLELSEIIFKKYPNDEAATISYVDNLMHLGERDQALLILFNSEKTAQTLLMEAIIYKEDMLYDVAEDKLKQAIELSDDEDLNNIINHELANVYFEEGRTEEALLINRVIFEKDPNVNSFKMVMDSLLSLGQYDEAVVFYVNYGHDFEDADIYFSAAFAYNQMHELTKSKDLLLKTIELDKDYVDAYMHLGFLSMGEEAIKYLEKYVEYQGLSTNVYLQLTHLYNVNQEYDKIRSMVRNVLTNMGIDNSSLYIAINALKTLYETETIYNIYSEHDLIKEDSSLLYLSLSALIEEEEYIDYVVDEIKQHHLVLKTEYNYYDLLQIAYEYTGDTVIRDYLTELELENSGHNVVDHLGSFYHEHDHHHSDDCDCGHH